MKSEQIIEGSLATRTINGHTAGGKASVSGLSLTHNFAWTLIGNAVYAGCQWVIVVSLAKLGSAEMVGQLALAMAVALPISLLANLQLRAVFVTDLDNKYPFAEMLGARLLLSVLAFSAILLFCKLASPDARTKEVIELISLAQLLDCLSENYYGIAQRYEHMDRIAKSQMIRSILSLVGFMCVLYSTGSLLSAVAALVLGRAVVLLAYDAGRSTFALANPPYQEYEHKFLKRVRPGWNFSKQLQMIWVALPLGTVAIVGVLSVNIPRYAIQHYLGPRELGIYSALNYIPTAVMMVTTALGNAAFARLSRLYFRGNLAAFARVLLRGSAVCGLIGIAALLGASFVGKQVLTILYRPEYSQRVDVLVWLMAAGAAGSVTTFLGCAMTATAQFRVQLFLFFVVVASSTLACLTMIPRLGLTGAALAALISMVVQGFGTVLVICKGLINRARSLTPDRSLDMVTVVEA